MFNVDAINSSLKLLHGLFKVFNANLIRKILAMQLFSFRKRLAPFIIRFTLFIYFSLILFCQILYCDNRSVHTRKRSTMFQCFHFNRSLLNFRV